jgi:hypothetical protein
MLKKLKLARGILIGLWVITVAGFYVWHWNASNILLVSGIGAMVEGAIRQQQ